MLSSPTPSAAGLLSVLFLMTLPLFGQTQPHTIQWLTFEQLEDSLSVEPKKVFIDFYTDWCRYCRKMDREVFTRPEVINLLNEEYYAVRLDAETEDTISFGGRQFINDQLGKSRRPLHQLAQLLALRKGQFVAPTLVMLDEEFRVTSRYFTYLDSKRLIRALE
ncbi:thioredoxin family protein [Lewinella sp. W8]|uniref:thioredoxin family protein n=1 Tax=Lewinella sp. W8 TaxID=2528208 RepID=UPI00106736CA|nr:thioredoxin family protein [Lewinella sp. W8]MTB53268.1 thioredoxin fold domain-containing protein [Lewinella sp. W8]